MNGMRSSRQQRSRLSKFDMLSQQLFICKQNGQDKRPTICQTVCAGNVVAVWDEGGCNGGMEGPEWSANDGNVCHFLWYLYTHIHRHDFNLALGQGKTFADWDDIKHHWDAYAQQAIGGEEHDDSDDDAGPTICWKKGQKRPQTVLPTVEDGTPMFPIILNMQALERKDIMRTLVTWHYCKFCLVNGQRIDPLLQARHAASQVPVFLGLPSMQRPVSTYHLDICHGIGSSKS